MGNLNLKIDISFQQLSDIGEQLSPFEKLKLNEVIWDENMEVPRKHQKLVSQRIKKARQNPDRLTDWDEASKKLKS